MILLKASSSVPIISCLNPFLAIQTTVHGKFNGKYKYIMLLKKATK